MKNAWIVLTAVLLAFACCLTACASQASDETVYQPLPPEVKAPYAPNPANYLPDNAGYVDDSISVHIRKERAKKYKTDVLIVDIDIKDVSQLRAARAGNTISGATERVANMAKANNAVIAMNGDFFVYHDFGYIVRYGKRLRAHAPGGFDLMIIDTKGDVTLLLNPSVVEVEKFKGKILHSYTFGPALIMDGEKVTKPGRSDSARKTTQRIAFCQRGPLSYSIVATEGPENTNGRGFTIQEFIDYLYAAGRYTQAFNLDGGSSSTVAFKGKKINSVSSNRIRAVYDIIYFATLVDSKKK